MIEMTSSSAGFKLPETDTCYFCDRLAMTATPGLIAETESTATLVNARQHQEGQVVVVPRRHAPTVLDLTEEEAIDAMRAAQRAARAMLKVFDMDGMLLYQNNGVASGQETPHFHLHVCPQRVATSRWGNEPPHIADALGRKFEPHEPAWLTDAELEAMAAKIRPQLEAP